MSTIIIPKSEYKKILRKQVNLQTQIADLKNFVIKEIKIDELNSSVIKQMGKISKSIDKGNGKFFNSITSLRSYLKNL